MIRLAALFAAAVLLVAGTPAALRAQANDAAAAQQDPPQTEAQKRAEERLIEVGKHTPDFTLPMVGGGEVTLNDLLKGNKAVLVMFWGIEPENGGDKMAKLQKLHEKLESKGLVTVTVNPVDSLSDVKEFAEMHRDAQAPLPPDDRRQRDEPGRDQRLQGKGLPHALPAEPGRQGRLAECRVPGASAAAGAGEGGHQALTRRRAVTPHPADQGR
jgi:hypothetical protein